MNWLLVAAGGAAGSVCRWLLVSATQRADFPTGTLLVNALGSLLVGFLVARLGAAQDEARLLLVTGFCGGFTTFSAFTLETLRLAHEGRAARAIAYIAASLAIGMVAVALGWVLGRRG